MQILSHARSLSNWLKKDEKALSKGIVDGMDIYELSCELEREPMAILRYITEAAIYDCEACGDEERELIGLALSGVPVNEAMLWCHADPARCTDIESLMKIGDMRLPLQWASDMGVCVSHAEHLTDLCWVMERPRADVTKARLSIERRFDIVTAYTLRRQITGLDATLLKDEPFPPLLRSTFSGTIALSYGKRRKARTTIAKSGVTTYRRSSRRKASTGRRRCASKTSAYARKAPAKVRQKAA